MLVPTNRGAALIRDALDGAGIPAVINGAGSVFATPIAREWLAPLHEQVLLGEIRSGSFVDRGVCPEVGTLFWGALGSTVGGGAGRTAAEAVGHNKLSADRQFIFFAELPSD